MALSPGAGCLPSANPADWPADPSWQPLLQAFWSSAAGRDLLAALAQRLRSGAAVYPAQPLRALELTPLHQVRVVILGQDPYHGPGQAEGLAFSVPPGVRWPPSLRNIFHELVRDGGGSLPVSGSLLAWAQQGVLLLNTCLTVEAGAAASHAGLGWARLTDALIVACSQQERPIAFLLWGAHAQAKAGWIDATRHLVLRANHPSPLSARRGPAPFVGCGHFGAANRWLTAQGAKTVDWWSIAKTVA